MPTSLPLKPLSFMHNQNSIENIKKLTPEEKYAFTLQLCYFIENGYLYSEEEQVKDFLKHLSSDPNHDIRQIIAEHLKHSSNLPREIALKLALDLNNIAIPIISYSPQLTEDDLIGLFDNLKEPKKIIALTQRSNLSEKICLKIVSTKNLELIINLLNNPTSQINPDLYQILLNSYYNDQLFLNTLLTRRNFNEKLLQKFVLDLNTEAKQIVIQHFNLYISNENKAFCPTDITSFEEDPINSQENELRRNIDLLYFQNSLNNAVIMHYLCKGDIYSFLYSLAKLSEVPFNQVRFIVLNHLTTKEFENLYYSSGLPANFLEAIQIILCAVINTAKDGKQITIEEFPQIIDKYLKENKESYKIEGLNYLLKLIFPK